ncbi:hypothetical protein ABTJ27_18630, partial [Acinetobacter baumannii]
SATGAHRRLAISGGLRNCHHHRACQRSWSRWICHPRRRRLPTGGAGTGCRIAQCRATAVCIAA